MSQVSTRRGWKAVALSGTLALVLAACGGGSDTGGGGGGGDEGSDEPILIGTSLPLTGEFSQPGKAAEEGYKVWQAMVNESGGILGRDVDLVIKDDASNQNTIVADYNALISQDKVDLLLGTFSSLLNLPASAVAERNQMLYVEPAGGSPEMFSRGFEYLFFAQQATADKQGKLFAECIAGLPEGERPATAAYPTSTTRSRRPTSRACARCWSRRHRDGLRGDLRDRHQELRHDRQRDEGGEPRRRRARRAVRGRRRHDPLDAQGRLHPEMVLPDQRPVLRRAVHRGHRRGEHRGGPVRASATRPTPTPRATPSSWPSTRRCSAPARSLRTPPTPSRPVRCCRPPSRRSAASRTRRRWRDWLPENEVETILGPLSWDEDRLRRKESSSSVSGRRARPEIVLPEEAATAEIVPGGARAAPADDPAGPEPRARPAPRRCLRARGRRADPDLRGHAGDQHRPRRVPDPGRLHHLLAVGAGWGSIPSWPSSSPRR